MTFCWCKCSSLPCGLFGPWIRILLKLILLCFGKLRTLFYRIFHVCLPSLRRFTPLIYRRTCLGCLWTWCKHVHSSLQKLEKWLYSKKNEGYSAIVRGGGGFSVFKHDPPIKLWLCSHKQISHTHTHTHTHISTKSKHCHTWTKPKLSLLFTTATILPSPHKWDLDKYMNRLMMPGQRNRPSRLDCTCDNKRRRDSQEAACIHSVGSASCEYVYINTKRAPLIKHNKQTKKTLKYVIFKRESQEIWCLWKIKKIHP